MRLSQIARRGCGSKASSSRASAGSSCKAALRFCLRATNQTGIPTRAMKPHNATIGSAFSVTSFVWPLRILTSSVGKDRVALSTRRKPGISADSGLKLAQQRTGLVAVCFVHIPSGLVPPFPFRVTTSSPVCSPHVVLVQTVCLSYWHPVPRLSPDRISDSEHSLPPSSVQNATASLYCTSPLHSAVSG